MCSYLFLFAGVEYVPSRFTLTDVGSANGSDANAGCPSACLRIQDSIRVCNCVGVTTDTTGITLIDGVIPMLDISQPNWAAQLYTATTVSTNLKIDFQFQVKFMLRHVDLYMVLCPVRHIPNQGLLSIGVYQSVLFPLGLRGPLLQNITLTMRAQSCENLIRISIPTNPMTLNFQYLIEVSMDDILRGIYIGEVNFSDESMTTVSSSM